ncbi:putative TIMELESS/TIM-1 protein [Daphnia sinensis]|uniref:TIMELESS/TIM-1 protein n=1 Tax=Daphnia sinensis TaxID=1820382 RepID=A0AAD5PV32_9CRUS|nr:putative TIMELESS/TIM-1 protein [Daphnia sinensis]
MDWLHLNGGAPSRMLIPLGTYYNNQYYISDQCLLCIEDLIRQLNCDDTKTHSRRRGLGYIDILNKDLKPILIISYRNWPNVFRSTVRLLVAITTPIESLVCDRTPDQRTYSSYVTYELKQLLYKAKGAFLDLSATRAIIDHIKLLLEKQPLASDETEFLNLCLLLIRNILDAPERRGQSDPPMSSYSESYNIELDRCSQQNEIMHNLFAQGFGKLLLDMLACSQKDKWVVTIAQIIAAIYKDRPAENIQLQLTKMFESSAKVPLDDDGENGPTPLVS